MKKLTLKSLGLFSLFFLVACGGSQTKTTNQTDAETIQVKLAKVEITDVEQLREFTGTVESFKQNDITPSIPVRIDKIHVEVGDKVKKGQLLVEMDVAQKRQLDIQLANLEKEYKRVSELHKAGGASQQQVDQLRTQLEVQRTSGKNMEENTELRSPIDGVVTGRYYHQGEMFSMSPTKSGKAAILTVMELAPLKVIINVSEEFFPLVKKGMPVTVNLDSYPGESFQGSVHLTYPTIDPITRNFTVEISIPNKDLKIRPGMFCRVGLNFGTVKRVVVPDLAVVKQAGTNDRYVFVYKNGVVKKTLVKLGRQIGTNYEITEGLNDGDQVVIAGQTRLVDQTAVEVIK